MRISQIAALSFIGLAAVSAMFADHKMSAKTVNKNSMGSLEVVH